MQSFTKQALAFGIIGCINTGIDVGSYTLLLLAGVPVICAIIIATSLGLASSYALNRRFTFCGSQHSRRSIIAFLSVTLVGLWVLQPSIIFGLTTLLSLHGVFELTIAKLIATGVSMVWNFFWYRTVVFK